MAKLRRRRRVPVQWLPVFGSNGTDSWQQLILEVDPDPSLKVTGHKVLTYDRPIDISATATTSASLADFIGSSYTLQRIVGKVIAGYDPRSQPENAIPAIIVAAGFFVAKADDTNPDSPAMSAAQFGVLEEDNMMEPWIWRRFWVLGDPSSVASIVYPASTPNYPSALDGPHLDTQVRRRIADDDRLFFAVSAQALYSAPEGQDYDPTPIRIILDYRILGTLRKNKNQSAF